MQLAFCDSRLRWIVIQPHCQIQRTYVLSVHLKDVARPSVPHTMEETAQSLTVTEYAAMVRRERQRSVDYASSVCAVFLLVCFGIAMPTLVSWA